MFLRSVENKVLVHLLHDMEAPACHLHFFPDNSVNNLKYLVIFGHIRVIDKIKTDALSAVLVNWNVSQKYTETQLMLLASQT